MRPCRASSKAALHRAGDLARAAGADRVVVDLADRHQLGGRAGQEDLVGQVELGARDVALDDLDSRGRARSG